MDLHISKVRSVRQHSKVRSVRQHKCDKCDFAADTRKELLLHEALDHRKVYSCPRCDFATVWKESLATHTHRGKCREVRSVDDASSRFCALCNRYFSTKAN